MIIITFTWVILALLAALNYDGSYTLNFISVTMVCVTGYAVIKKSGNFGVIVLGLVISYVSASILCAFAETGVWFSEAKTFAELSGATARNSSLAAVIMISAYTVYKSLSKTETFKGGINRSINESLLTGCCVLSVLLSITLIAINLIYGHPNDYNVDRFYYWANIAPAWGEYVNFMSTQMVVFLGLAYGVRNKRVYLILFLLSLISQLLVGEKATGLYASILMFIIPTLISRKIYLGRIIFKPQFITLSICVIVGLTCAIYLSYVAMGGESNAFAMLMNRLVLQAQMWWAVDNISTGGVSYPEVMSAIFGSKDGVSGIQYLMREVADPSTFSWFEAKGVNWTMASPANLTYLFGYYAAFIPAVLIGLMFGLSSHIVVKAIQFRDVVLIFLSIKLYNGVWQAATMGNLDSLISLKVLFVLLVAVFYLIGSRTFTRKLSLH